MSAILLASATMAQRCGIAGMQALVLNGLGSHPEGFRPPHPHSRTRVQGSTIHFKRYEKTIFRHQIPLAVTFCAPSWGMSWRGRRSSRIQNPLGERGFVEATPEWRCFHTSWGRPPCSSRSLNDEIFSNRINQVAGLFMAHGSRNKVKQPIIRWIRALPDTPCANTGTENKISPMPPRS